MPPYAGTRALIVAQFDDAANAHNTLRRRALERLGCHVGTFDPGQSTWVERLTRADLTNRFARSLDQNRPDFVLVIGDPGMPLDLLRELKVRRGTTLVNWYPGDMRGLTMLRSAIGIYDHFFAAGTDLAAHLGAIEGARASFLPVAADPSVYRPMRARGPFRANVVFAGAATPRREQLLAELVEFGLAVWGPGWRKTGLRDYCRGELPTTEDFVRAYAGATVGINIHQSIDPDPAHDSRACNQRLFELAAIGVAQVVDKRGDLPLHFEEGTEVLVFENPAELKGLVKRALHEDGYRERLHANARQRAMRDHTYMHRMLTLLEVVMPVVGAAGKGAKARSEK